MLSNAQHPDPSRPFLQIHLKDLLNALKDKQVVRDLLPRKLPTLSALISRVSCEHFTTALSKILLQYHLELLSLILHVYKQYGILASAFQPRARAPAKAICAPSLAQ